MSSFRASPWRVIMRATGPLLRRRASTPAVGSRITALREVLSQEVAPGMELDLCKLQECLQSKFDGIHADYFGKDARRPHVRQRDRWTYELNFAHPACFPLWLRIHDRAAHEFHINVALHAHQESTDGLRPGLPVPQPFILIEDCEIMGKPFFVSAAVQGRTFFDAAFTDAPDAVNVAGVANARMGSMSTKAFLAPPEERRGLQESLFHLAAAVHSLDSAALGLEQQLPQQLDGGLRELARMATEVFHAWSAMAREDARLSGLMEELMRWLPTAIPAADEDAPLRCLVHGDLHVEHLVFHSREPTVLAVRGWEGGGQGHPGADLALLALPYITPATLNTKHQGFGLPPAREALGLPSLDALLDAYVDRTGFHRVREHFDFYLALACYRVAAATASRPEPTPDELRFAAQMAGAGVGCAQRYRLQCGA